MTRFRSRRGALAALATLWAPVFACAPSAEPPKTIVLIVIDTLRADHLSCYGGAVPTPNIDALAARGALFPNVLASFHQTTMSMSALFTGRTPSIESGDPAKPLPWTGRTWCGLERLRQDEDDEACVPHSLPTLAEELREAGYGTVGVASNKLLYRPSGYEQGFDDWVELPTQPVPGGVKGAAKGSPEQVVNGAVRKALLRHAGEERLFLYVHFMDVHDYALLFRSYAEGVEAADAAVGRLVGILREAGRFEGATLVLTSDHGEWLGEPHAIKPGFNHFGNPSYEEVLRVPLIVAPAPGGDPTRFLRGQDVHSLVLSLAGAGTRDTAGVPELARDELLVTELDYQTYRKGRWKILRHRTDGNVVLFDLDADPDQRQDVAAGHATIRDAHIRRIDQLTRLLAAEGQVPAELSPDDIERLKALGYLE